MGRQLDEADTNEEAWEKAAYYLQLLRKGRVPLPGGMRPEDYTVGVSPNVQDGSSGGSWRVMLYEEG